MNEPGSDCRRQGRCRRSLSQRALEACFLAGAALAPALGCSAVPHETALLQPVATLAPSAFVAPPPRAAPRTSGIPVVLGLQQPTIVAGMEWAWLLPEARLVTLAPEDSAGHRAILGQSFFAGPRGAILSIDGAGELHFVADGASHSLGPFSSAGFDGEGRSALVWNDKEWAVFSRSGERLRGNRRTTAEVELLPSGLLLERNRAGTRLVRPPDAVLVDEPSPCLHTFALSRRLVCMAPDSSAGPRTSVFSLETGERLAKISEPPGVDGLPGVAFRGDGSALALVRAEAQIVDLRPGNPYVWPRVIARNLTFYPVQHRVAFTADGAHLCIETGDGTRIAKTAAPGGVFSLAKDRRALCVFTPRLPVPVFGGNSAREVSDWEASIFEAPVHAGFNLVRWGPGTQRGHEVTSASADKKTVAFVEQKTNTTGEERLWTVQAVVLDAATGAERRTIRVGEKLQPVATGSAPPWLELSPDGSRVRVCAPLVLSGTCRTYETATGAIATTDFQSPQARKLTGMQVWSGPSPEARVADLLTVLPPRTAKAPRVAAWRDEGAYLSIELDLGGGVSQHLNVKDAVERVAKEVEPVGNGKLLAIAAQGSVVLWSVQPIEIQAVLVPLEGGIAALLPDGTFEAIGEVESAIRCQQGDALVPVAQCGELRAPAGTLGRIVKEATR
jgi:hypothetical protein